MSLLFMDGFSHYATGDILRKWDALNGITIDATHGRRGGGAAKGAFVNGGSYLTKNLPANLHTVIAGFASFIPAFQNETPILNLYDGGTQQMHVRVGTDGKFNVYDGNGHLLGASLPGKYVAGVYQYVEFKVTIGSTNGSITIRVNGVIVLFLPGINTQATLNAYATSITYCMPKYQADDCFFCDVYLCDTNGTVNNDFLGDTRIDTLFPSADGTYLGLTPSAGTDHFSLVNEVSMDTTSFISGSITGTKDSFVFTDLPTDSRTIKGVQVVNLATKDDAGDRSIKNLIRSSGVESQSDPLPLQDNWHTHCSISESDPATSAQWTQSGVDAAEFGVVVA